MFCRYATLLVVILAFCSACEPARRNPTPQVIGNRVTVAVGTLPESKPLFLSLPIDGTTVTFFLVRIEGEVQSYFDACNRCYRSKKGYGVEEGAVVCRRCNVRYPLTELKGGVGSCHPVPLPGRLEKDNYIIDLSDLREGCRLFP